VEPDAPVLTARGQVFCHSGRIYPTHAFRMMRKPGLGRSAYRRMTKGEYTAPFPKKSPAMMKFDERGYLMPYEITELNLKDFKAFFVTDLNDSAHRSALFQNYLSFVEGLKKTFGATFYQWIAGSFVTQKTLPGDIDVVTFLPFDAMTKKAGAIDIIKSSAKENYRIDAHFAYFCKWNHRFYEQAKEDENEFRVLFGFSREDENRKRWPKGIIQIKFLP
jgi:hypothetical protein